MQIPSFNIQYNTTHQPAKARLTSLCSPSELSTGLKDICIYLRNGIPAGQPDAGAAAHLYITWEKNTTDIRELTGEEISTFLEQIAKELSLSLQIDTRMRTSNFIFDDLIRECQELILNIQTEGIDTVMGRSKKKISYLLNEIGDKIIVRNRLIVRSAQMDQAQIQQILQQIYDDIPRKVRKYFDYIIDFESLSFEKR